MDDIWDIDSWEQIESSFPDDKNGSRILFTSRNHDLASQVKPNSVSHPLPLFSDEGSWALLKRRIFGSDICDEAWVGIGRKIASYCNGLPLAVVLTAAVLGKTKRSLDSWIEVAENLKTHLANEGFGKVIELSYKCLPEHLKSCFLYFGVYRRGKIVKAAELKLLWIGEGFIIQDGKAKSTDGDLATDYLNDLVSQGLVIVTKWSSMDEIKECSLHDLLYDLCLEKVKEDNFLNWIEENVVVGDHISGVENKTNFHISRRLIHHRLLIGSTDPFIKSNSTVSKWELPTSALNTFLWSKHFSDTGTLCPDFFGSFKIVTVLKLKLGRTDEFPVVILSSLHLRYLALKFQERFKAVPPKIAKLLELRTLIIDWYSSRYNRPVVCASLPPSLWSMKRLRHINIRYAFSESEEDFNSKTLSMCNVETVGKIVLHGDDRTTVEFLQKFANLRKLSCDISGERNNNILEWLSIVGSMLPELLSLKVDCTEMIDEDGYPHEENPNQVILNLHEIGNLRKLTLYHTKISWSILSRMGKQLPNLRILKLLEDSCVGRSWKLEDGDFSKLILLNLMSLDIEEIDVSSCEDNPSFPSLEHFSLYYCQNIQEIPLAFGEICGLKKIHVTGCKTKVTTSAMQILDERAKRLWKPQSSSNGQT